MPLPPATFTPKLVGIHKTLTSSVHCKICRQRIPWGDARMSWSFKPNKYPASVHVECAIATNGKTRDEIQATLTQISELDEIPDEFLELMVTATETLQAALATMSV